METIHEKIKRLRIDKRINQIELANSIGVSRSAYILIENGSTKSISIELGKRLAKELGVSFNELFEVENPDLEIAKMEIERLKKSSDFNETLIKLSKENTKNLEAKSRIMDKLARFVNLLFFVELVDKQKLIKTLGADFGNQPLIKCHSFETVLRFFNKYGDEIAIDLILDMLDEETIKNDSDYVFDKAFWNGLLPDITSYKDYVLERISKSKTQQ